MGLTCPTNRFLGAGEPMTCLYKCIFKDEHITRPAISCFLLREAREGTALALRNTFLPVLKNCFYSVNKGKVLLCQYDNWTRIKLWGTIEACLLIT